MAELKMAIGAVRKSTVAILRLRQTAPNQYESGSGSGFCIVADRYVLTAFHNLNRRQQKDPQDKFYVLTAPGNGASIFIYPVVGFPLERPDVDIAVLEIGPCVNGAEHIPTLPVSFAQCVDGSRVMTLGFPAPEIYGFNMNPDGVLVGGQFFFMSHANEGIVAAQYSIGSERLPLYEFNVAWHHGESGGPVTIFEEQPAAITLMQQYRNVQGPHGIMAGPRRGIALSFLERELREIGATVI